MSNTTANASNASGGGMQIRGPVLAAALLATAPAHAQSAGAASAIEFAHQAEQLRPGQWVWAPEISPYGPVVVHVDLSRQLVTVYRNGVRIGVSTASSGRRGYETPPGVYTVLQKRVRHRSNLYSNAPMPYMIRLTWDGVALHGGAVRNRPVSHGCVRLPMAFARELFQIMPMGGTVVVVGDAATPADAPVAGVLTPVRVGGFAEMRAPLRVGQAYSWRPEASWFGPVTVVMSLSDQHVVVLRNGVEIGRARASIPTDDTSTRVLTFTGEGALQWIEADGSRDLNATPEGTIVQRVRMPTLFEQALRNALTPGSTMLVTQAPVLEPAPPPVTETTAADAPVADMQ